MDLIPGAANLMMYPVMLVLCLSVGSAECSLKFTQYVRVAHC